MKKSLLNHLKKLSAVLVIAGASATTLATVTAEDSKPIATVGKTTITQEQLYNELKAAYGESALRTMILKEVLQQNVKDADAVKKAAEDEVANQIKQAGGEEVFQQLLTYQNYGTIEDFKAQLYIQKLLEEVVTAQVDTSDEAVKAYYDNGYSPKMEAQHILVDTEEEAQAALDRINNGEAFEDVAKEVSKDSTAQNGGLLDPFGEGEMVAEFEAAVKAGTNGEVVAAPVKSQYGYHVIKVLNNGEKKAFDEVKDEVKQALLDSKLNDQAFSLGVVADLVEAAKVKIEDKDLANAVQAIIDSAKSAKAAAESSAAAASDSTAEDQASDAEASETTSETSAE